MKHWIILFYILLKLTVSTIGQVSTKPIDTLSIFKSKSGVGYRMYEHKWSLRAGNWGYRPRKMNKQDSIVFIDSSAHYLKVFNQRNVLEMEGFKDESGSFYGEVKFYNGCGSLFKIEQWDSGICIDTLGEIFCDDYGPIAIRKTYYKSNRTIKKSIYYTIVITNRIPLEYKFSKQTIRP